ncbi:hypothetical protein FE257_005554 [Aspergillus nanangensis]|uniref:Uncharacterized protein n=1 Tax=Aspergillus nanangensis TaxID=2582783 RepID=A0AAD4CRY0_ASPNN|nr:hypothetical protein FE257_005554 [Aspergillus nanangensis]
MQKRSRNTVWKDQWPTYMLELPKRTSITSDSLGEQGGVADITSPDPSATHHHPLWRCDRTAHSASQDRPMSQTVAETRLSKFAVSDSDANIARTSLSPSPFDRVNDELGPSQLLLAIIRSNPVANDDGAPLGVGMVKGVITLRRSRQWTPMPALSKWRRNALKSTSSSRSSKRRLTARRGKPSSPCAAPSSKSITTSSWLCNTRRCPAPLADKVRNAYANVALRRPSLSGVVASPSPKIARSYIDLHLSGLFHHDAFCRDRPRLLESRLLVVWFTRGGNGLY